MRPAGKIAEADVLRLCRPEVCLRARSAFRTELMAGLLRAGSIVSSIRIRTSLLRTFANFATRAEKRVYGRIAAAFAC